MYGKIIKSIKAVDTRNVLLTVVKAKEIMVNQAKCKLLTFPPTLLLLLN